MNRRGFLGSVFAGAALPMISFADSRIWVPTDQGVEQIQVARSLVPIGKRVFGYLIHPEYTNSLDLTSISKHALQNFESGNPLLILSDTGNILRRGKVMSTFTFIGSESEAVNAARAELIGGFDSSTSFAWKIENDLRMNKT